MPFAPTARGLATLVLVALPWSSVSAAPAYTPTQKDMLSINATLHRYLKGLDQHDSEALASAFAEDGALMLFDRGKLLVSRQGRAEVKRFVSAPAAAPPAGEGPPAEAAGDGGAQAQPAPAKDMFHIIANEYYDFKASDRAEHYAYWVDITPNSNGSSNIGVPGHYEDVFVKRRGEWYLLERKIFVGTK